MIRRIKSLPPFSRYPPVKTIALKTIAVITLLGSGGVVGACQSLPQSAFQLNETSLAQGEPLSVQDRVKLERELVSIERLLNTAENQTETPLVLQGTITQVAPFLTGVAYELTDKTGKIWVVSKGTNPEILTTSDLSANSETTVFWIIGTPQYQSIAVGGQDWGEVYLQEQSRFQAN